MDSPKTPPRARPLAIEPSSPRVFLSAAYIAASPESHRHIAVNLSDESAYAVKWVVQNYLRSKPTLTGFMGGAAVIVSLQQLKGLLGIVHFTTKMGFIPVMESVFENRGEWAWQTVVMGLSFLAFLLIAKHISLRRPKLFWVSAAAPLTSVILSTIISFVFKAPNHGIKTIGHLQKGLNPPSANMLDFEGPYLSLAIKTGIVTGILALTEGIAVGRTFASLKNYQIDGNKEMMAIGVINMAGFCASCYVTTGSFSRIPKTVGMSIPMKATFFITYIMVDGWASVAAEILKLKTIDCFPSEEHIPR